MLDFLLDIFFPKQCLGCQKWGKYICDDCRKYKIEYLVNQTCPYCEKLSPLGLTHPRCETKNGLDGLFVLAHYRGIIPKAIREIKYRGYFAIISEFAQLIVQKYHNGFKFQYFVPIPLSKNRERTRGFNQAEKLSKDLVKSLISQKKTNPQKNQVVPLLIRTRDTRPQFDLKYEQRKSNLKDAFALNNRLLTKDLSGVSFCLIDDVATTGSTLFECAKVLKKSGAQKVYGITIARGG